MQITMVLAHVDDGAAQKGYRAHSFELANSSRILCWYYNNNTLASDKTTIDKSHILLSYDYQTNRRFRN